MVCIYCRSKTSIVNSRHLNRSNGTWRRRKCTKCGATFSTTESASYNSLWLVRNPFTSDMSPFSRDKLYMALYDSCKHRADALSNATDLTDTVINLLIKSRVQGVIDIGTIRRICFEVLKRFDKVASVHYKAYYGPI